MWCGIEILEDGLKIVHVKSFVLEFEYVLWQFSPHSTLDQKKADSGDTINEYASRCRYQIGGNFDEAKLSISLDL